MFRSVSADRDDLLSYFTCVKVYENPHSASAMVEGSANATVTCHLMSALREPEIRARESSV